MPAVIEPPASPRARWLGLVGLTLGVSLIIVDSTILNVAIPAIVADLGLTLAGAQWANTIYALVLASMLVTAGRFADRVGRRRAFVGGIALFLLGSVAAGLAWSPPALLVARFVQGLGGAVILPTTLSLVNANFRGRERAAAFAVYGSVIGGVVALGPLLGGWCITTLSWRWAFFVNVPLALIAITLVWRGIPESKDPAAPRGGDLLGTLAFAGGIAALVFVAIDGRTWGWWQPSSAPFTIGGWSWPANAPVSVVPLVGLAGLVLLGAFAVIERRHARRGEPTLVEFSLFRIGSFAAGSVTAAVVSLGELGIVFFLPLWFQQARGYSALETGVALIALAGGAFVAAGMVAALTPRIGRKRVVVLGLALELVGILVLALTISPDVSILVIEVGMFVYGVGVGFATAQLTSLILGEVPIALSGAASGLSSTARQLGSALGIAIIGSVFAISLQRGVEQARGTAFGSDAAVLAAADGAALSAAARSAGLAAAGFVLVGLLVALRLPDVRDSVESA